MAGNIKGITIEFRGNPTPLQKAIRQVDSELKKTTKELSNVNKALKFNPGSVDLWKQKQQLLKEKINETTDKLKALKAAQKQMDDANVDKSSEQYRKLQREIIETESQLKHFKGELRAIGNVSLKALSEQFKNIGTKLTDAGKTLTTKITVPLAAVGAASLKVGADFDTAMSQVAATMGTTVDEIQELRDFAKEMGSTTAFSATQAAEGLNYMALAGYSAEESMEMLPTVLNLAAAGAMELGAASDMVTDAQTALGLSAEETATMVDQMAKASSQSNTSVSQLGEAILKIGPNAKAMAGGTKELNTVLGVLADNGIKGSEAGTHLRNILLSMNTDKVKDAFHEMGVEVYDAEGNMRDLTEIFPELQQAMSGLTSEERTGMLAKLFNKTDLSSLNSLLDTSAERWTELGSAIEDSGGAAAQMADTQLDNLQGSLTLLKSALEGAGIAISDTLAPYVKQLAEWVTGLVDKFNNLSPATQKIITIIGVVAAAIGPVLVILGTLASSIGSIISLVGTIIPVITGAGAAIGGLMSGALLPIIGIIAAVIAIGVLLYKNWDTIKAKAIALWTSIKTTFDGIKTSITTTWNNIKTAISNAVNNIRTKIVGTFNAVKATVSSIWNGIKSAIVTPIQTAVGIVKNAIHQIKEFLGGLKFELPKFKLPHFSVKGSFPYGIGGKGEKPSISVDWYAQGGIFNRPTVLAGIGEAGPEAVVPLDKFWAKMDAMGGGQNIVININGANKDPREIAEEVKRVLIRETNQRRLAWQ